MDCPDTCALEIEVQDGKIQKIFGSTDHPTTNGFICSKIANFARRVYHKERLLYPMHRIGPKGNGRFRRICWEEAIEEICSRFRDIIREVGGEAILPFHYGGSNGLLGEEFLDDYFFARLGASRMGKTLCAAPTTKVAVGMYGKMPGVAFEDYTHAKFILLWGVNPKVSHIHLVPFLKKAKKNGAFIASIDPRRNYSSGEIDLHLPVFPGADLPLALGMIHYWQKKNILEYSFLEKYGVGYEKLLAAAQDWSPERAAKAAQVPLRDLIFLAEKYAQSSPAVIRCGWGVERNRNGGQAAAAILGMPALLGKFGVRGGGYTMSNSGATRLNIEKIFGPIRWNTRTINMSQLGKALNETKSPPIKALFVYNCNPAVTVPDQNSVLKGLQREDLFTVVFEQVMTDSAQYADILLPAVTFMEQYEVKRSYGSYVVGGVHPAVPPAGEAKPNEEVFAMLGREMDWDDPPFHWDTKTYMEKVVSVIRVNGEKVDRERLLNGRIHPVQFNGETPVQFKTVFPNTKERKIYFVPAALGKYPFRYQPVISEDYPLALITPGSSKMISSSMGEFNFKELFVAIHPGDAAPRKIQSGDMVRVYNNLGEVVCRAKLSNSVRRGVVSMPKGAWRNTSANGKTSTALCPSHVNEVGGGACFNDARVEVEKFPD